MALRTENESIRIPWETHYFNSHWIAVVLYDDGAALRSGVDQECNFSLRPMIGSGFTRNRDKCR